MIEGTLKTVPVQKAAKHWMAKLRQEHFFGPEEQSLLLRQPYIKQTNQKGGTC
jgi:hypothetical protein